MTPHQLEIFNEIIPEIESLVINSKDKNPILSLIGSAGVGKTYLTTKIIKELLDKNIKVTITTPTHKALKVVKNMLKKENIFIDSRTIHSFLRLKLKPNYENGLQELVPDDFNKNKNRTDVLIVDESSMVCDNLFKFIQNAIKIGRAKCVLFVGDYFQLPPVSGEINPVFEMKKQYELIEIVRQAKDNPIIQLATEIREHIKNNTRTDLKSLISKYSSDKICLVNEGKEFLKLFLESENPSFKWYDKDQIITSFTNDAVDNYNKSIRLKYWKDKGYNPENITFLMVGDTVIFQEAHTEGDTIIHANNDIVTITSLKRIFDTEINCWFWECVDEEGLKFRVIDPISKRKFNDYLNRIASLAHSAKGADKKKLWQTYFRTKGLFQEIKYCFASTVHKLQGSTFDYSFIDLRGILYYLNEYNYNFIYRLVYVAITRASEKVIILQ